MRTIGRGGMGAVYEARDEQNNQAVCAIKEMSLSKVPPEERAQAIKNFRAEAEMLGALDHPNLPTVTDFFTEGSRYFLVMEYIDGLTLEEDLERNGSAFPERRVLGWARQLCSVLTYLHSRRTPIIFRDLKPGNIMLMRNGRIKLIDFGIARLFRHSSSQDTQLLGTPGYAPPEQYGKAQTDERSDIYSLAMTLFQLLTNTLSENGFGLTDVRSVNPTISLLVARALEKATSLSPDDRFQSVEAFRRALLGEGTFVFETGDQATTVQELAELCSRFPEEAADYLFDCEIESWLQEIGETGLARATKNIRTTTDDPEEAVQRFLQTVLGSKARIRSSSGTVTSSPGTITHSSRRWPLWGPASDVVVQPRTLDFGEVYPGTSAPLSLSITGDKGAFIRGTITTTEPWILIDQSNFEGMVTRVNVRVNSTRLHGSPHFSGTVLVTPETDEDEEQAIPVKVQVSILGNDTIVNTPAAKGPFRIGGSSPDPNDPTIATGAGGMMMAPRSARNANPNPKSLFYTTARYNEYRAKYGKPGGTNTTSAFGGWDPLQMTLKQGLWLHRGITVLAAFMVASFFYTFLSQLPLAAHHSLLAGNPWLIVVLASIVPMATLGALIVNWKPAWSFSDSINRLSTGASAALFVLGLSELAWHSLLHFNSAPFELFFMLLIGAITAMIGIHETVSENMIKGIIWGINFASLPVMIAVVVFGGILGFCLTLGFSFSLFTLFGILWGLIIAVLFIFRIEQLHKQGYP